MALSDAAREAGAAEAVATEPGEDQVDPRMRMLIQIVEALTGRKVVFYQQGQDSAPEIEPLASPDKAPAEASQRPPTRQGPEFNIRYDYHEVREEAEIAHFAASGKVRSADGREISFDLELEMARYEREEINVSVEIGTPRRKDPLVLNLTTDRVRLESGRFDFDLDADGETESIARLGSGSAYLALDRDGDGAINNGRELFGPQTNEGFQELAALDDDGNGWIDEGDAAFSSLKLWRPGDETMVSLKDAGVGAIALENRNTPYTLKDDAGNVAGAIRNSGLFLFEDGGVGTAQQIDLVV